MIRVVWMTSLLLVLMLVLYLPSVHPPERFIAQLNVEHERNRAFWGEDTALRIVSRMLELHADMQQAAAPAAAASPGQPGSAPSAPMSQVIERFFHNPYFTSIGALFALATYRLAALAESLPTMSVFILAALLDGLIRRIVKSEEFLHHNPELFALHASLAILIACATVVVLVLPVTVHPLLLALAPAVIGVLASLASAHYHRR